MPIERLSFNSYVSLILRTLHILIPTYYYKSKIFYEQKNDTKFCMTQDAKIENTSVILQFF